MQESGRAQQNFSTLITSNQGPHMKRPVKQRPQSGRPAPHKLSLQARYDLPREVKNEPFKLPKYKKQKRDVNFSP